MKRNTTRFGAAAAMLVAAIAPPTQATFHFWDIVEVFSSADGSLQFVEFFTTSNGQDEAAQINRRIESDLNSFVFGVDLPGGNATANKSMLVGTVSYAAVAGVPAPDYIVPDHFFNINGDTLEILEDDPTPVIDSLAFTAPDLPTDGTNSLNHPFGDNTANFNSAPNSPTNFAGETGAVPGVLPGDANNDGQVTGADLIAVQQNFGNIGPAHGLLPGDCNDDGQVTGADLICVQQNFGNVLAAAAGSVPEPATLSILLAAALLAAALLAARRRAR